MAEHLCTDLQQADVARHMGQSQQAQIKNGMIALGFRGIIVQHVFADILAQPVPVSRYLRAFLPGFCQVFASSQISRRWVKNWTCTPPTGPEPRIQQMGELLFLRVGNWRVLAIDLGNCGIDQIAPPVLVGQISDAESCKLSYSITC